MLLQYAVNLSKYGVVLVKGASPTNHNAAILALLCCKPAPGVLLEGEGIVGQGPENGCGHGFRARAGGDRRGGGGHANAVGSSRDVARDTTDA